MARVTEVTMKSMCRPAVLLPVLLLWAVCSVWNVQADVRTVKLCGREFIRAVVYTCGGSRWRRLSSPQDGEGEFDTFTKYQHIHGLLMDEFSLFKLMIEALLVAL